VHGEASPGRLASGERSVEWSWGLAGLRLLNAGRVSGRLDALVTATLRRVLRERCREARRRWLA
jgi:hypothetical protein